MSPEAEIIAAQSRLFASVVVAGEAFCIDINYVRENRRWAPPTAIPHAPPYMMGTMNLRGEVIPIIDLATIFGFPPIKAMDRHVIIVIEYGGKIIGLVAEAVRRILSVTPEQIRDAPGAKTERNTMYIQGLVMQEIGLIRIIDIGRVVAAMEGEI